MLYTTFNIDGVEYKARLNAKACVDVEKKLGTNPLNVFGEIATTGKIPELNTLMVILHGSLQAYQHNMTLDKTYELYDAFINEGNTMMDLIPIIMEIFKVSGFYKEEEEQGKNA